MMVLAVGLVASFQTIFDSFQWNSIRIWMPAAKEHPTARFQPAGQPESTLYHGLPGVIKPPMDVGTVVHRLKRGLYGSVRDLLLDVELFMANATRSTSPPPSGVSTSGRGRRLTSDGSDDLEQPEKELAMASLWPVPDALGGCSDAADAAVGGGAGLGTMLTSGGQSGKMVTDVVIGHTPNGSLRSFSQVPAQPVVEAAKERRGHAP
jgi:hypothetical protein